MVGIVQVDRGAVEVVGEESKLARLLGTCDAQSVQGLRVQLDERLLTIDAIIHLRPLLGRDGNDILGRRGIIVPVDIWSESCYRLLVNERRSGRRRRSGGLWAH